MTELSDLEEKAIGIIREEGSIPQSELWKKLDCSATKGSKIARRLESEGLISRDKIAHNGFSTYSLNAKRKSPEKLDFSLLVAGDMLPPFINDEDVEYKDDRFTQWILNLDSEA